MLIGSHNSLSYLPPKKWWMRPFHWMARCQSVDYKKQYELGARVFDLRLWFDKRGWIEVRHGRIAFKSSCCTVDGFLSWLDKQGGCAVRVILEEDNYARRHTSKCYLSNNYRAFLDRCEIYETAYRNIKFFGGNRKYDWKVLYDFGNDISLDDKYSSTTSLFKSKKRWLARIDDLWPWLYARLHNWENFKKGTNKDCLFIDFVNIL